MFLSFFLDLRHEGVPASLKEFLTLLDGVRRQVADLDVDDFYYLSRSCLVKDERHLDKFDRVFARCFQVGPAGSGGGDADDLRQAIPDEWLRALAERHLSEEERAQVQALGGWDKLMETLRERLREQRERHEGGSKWIGTAGTSPFGAQGYNPEGVRIGQEGSRHRRAVKVWDRREFRNLDDQVELGARNVQLALRRLRKFAHEGAATQLDLPGTIQATAHNGGYLDLHLVPERHNAVKVLLLLDIGGSMDDHVRTCAELFTAARSEFKHLTALYFHNCLYEEVWADNRRRHQERVPVSQLLRTYQPDYRVIFVGDACMSPYEIVHPGGSVEHSNREPGEVWLRRVLGAFPHAVWLNPMLESDWQRYTSVEMIRRLMEGRMFPLTLAGLDAAMRELKA